MNNNLIFLILFLSFNTLSNCQPKKNKEIEYSSIVSEMFLEAEKKGDGKFGALILMQLFLDEYYLQKYFADIEGDLRTTAISKVMCLVGLKYYNKLRPEIIKLLKSNNDINFFIQQLKDASGAEDKFFITIEHVDLEKVRREYNVNFDYRNGKTIFLNSAKYALEDIFNDTLKREININYKNEKGATALHYLVMRSDRLDVRKKIFDALVDHIDFNINAVTNKGWTPLHMACAHGNLWAVEKLLKTKKHTIDFSLETSDNKNALDLAIEYGHVEIVGVLAEYLINERLK